MNEAIIPEIDTNMRGERGIRPEEDKVSDCQFFTVNRIPLYVLLSC